ncbi:probable fucosyltransferase 7 [Cajanus cajan]|uniref:probable fucosyltransferase 7 n=1 Tax=Cajanus cajan TaxID=3821 RepID=UPI00098DB5E1|nr:probable fucosyltransferase 7 [Cajanus cajan]XP_020225976.1 probable fucosyltransferase 7 [Cajanus cajan]XP_029129204.1 probable fucosyltransferase 7 [Cajanus cajan]
MDQIMGQNCMSLRMFLVIAFPVVVIVTVTLMYQNSGFGLFEGFSGGIIQGGTTQNVTAELLTGGPNVTTHGFELGGRVQNITHDSLGESEGGVKELQGRSQNDATTEGRTKNITAADGGPKNVSLTSSTNESTQHAVNHDDKLLGGLLASGFDETSCKSRMQSHLYRKASPHKPSPYLISKLRGYEEIHRRCGPSSKTYDKSMRKIEHSKNNGVATTCKYLIFTPANGLGNQMISLAATFLYAVLTDRVLLVKFGSDKHGLFCEPFLNSTWILPKKSPFWNEKHIETYQFLLEKDRVSNSTEDLPPVLFMNLQHSLNDPEKLFHCGHSQDLLRKIPMLILQSDQYFVPSMFMNPFYSMEITKMFLEKDVVFHHLGRYLFHPSNEAWEFIRSYYKAHLAKAAERIGLQIRVFKPETTPTQAIMDLVLSCTLKHKILPEVGLETSVSYAKKKQTTKAVLVASLSPEYGDNLRTMYHNKPTISGEVIQVYQPSHEGHQKSNDNKHNLKAWMDMYLLSLSDVLVTTSLSTFGYVAQGLGNLKPWLLYRILKNESHFPACERDFSLEPCYHVPPKHYCNGMPMPTKELFSSFPYLRECKDFYLGVKMVNDSM